MSIKPFIIPTDPARGIQCIGSGLWQGARVPYFEERLTSSLGFGK